MRAATTSRTKSERRRSDMRSLSGEAYSAAGGRGRAGLLGRRQDEAQGGVLIVGREQVRNRLGGKIALGVDHDALAQTADAPLEGHADVVLLALEVQPE